MTMTGTTSSVPQASFLGIPPELRNSIYRHIICDTPTLRIRDSRLLDHPLALTCKQLRSDFLRSSKEILLEVSSTSKHSSANTTSAASAISCVIASPTSSTTSGCASTPAVNLLFLAPRGQTKFAMSLFGDGAWRGTRTVELRPPTTSLGGFWSNECAGGVACGVQCQVEGVVAECEGPLSGGRLCYGPRGFRVSLLASPWAVSISAERRNSLHPFCESIAWNEYSLLQSVLTKLDGLFRCE